MVPLSTHLYITHAACLSATQKHTQRLLITKEIQVADCSLTRSVASLSPPNAPFLQSPNKKPLKMPFVFSSSSPLTPCSCSHYKSKCGSLGSPYKPPALAYPHSKIHRLPINVPSNFKSKVHTALRRCASGDGAGLSSEPIGAENAADFGSAGQGPAVDIEDIGSPWEGAVVYKRNPSITHVEYCTTLERLGLGNYSSDVSRSKASLMGLRVTKAVKDFPLGTPVQISIDVTRRKKKLRLDGIIRTVLALDCVRCGKPAGQSVFSNFSLLLSEEPIQEPDVIDMGVLFGDGESKKIPVSDDMEGNDDDSIDWDDRLYFPFENKEVDISKNVRDMVHVEITMDVFCDAGCKGMCLKCGTNLNLGGCGCNKQAAEPKGFGPLGDLKKQMQQTR